MNLPKKSLRRGTRGYAHLVEIGVPVSRVWRGLTDPDLIRLWSGQKAEIDARTGGWYRLGNPNDLGREAHIDIFDPNRRLRLIYLKGGDWPHGESAVVDDFLLDPRKGDGKTSLRLLGSGVPEAPEWDKSYMRIRVGWERYMARLKVILESPPVPKKPKVETPKDPPLPGLDY
jgi:uncharacterized protein YndB with AHSA1/START domain